MSKKQKLQTQQAVFRLEPEKRLCPIYDPTGIRTFPVAQPEEMGFRVVDNFPEEHIQ